MSDVALSEEGLSVVARARHAAAALGNRYLGVEHVFLGLLDEPSGLTHRVLKSLDAPIETIRARVTSLGSVAWESSPAEADPALTPRAHRIMELATDEARKRGEDSVGPGHMLLALLEEDGGGPIEVLRTLNIYPPSIARRTRRALDEHRNLVGGQRFYDLAPREEIQSRGIEHRSRLGRVAALVGELKDHPDPAVGERVTQLMGLVDAFHRDSLDELVEMVREWRGELFLKALAGNEVVSNLLSAYELASDRN